MSAFSEAELTTSYSQNLTKEEPDARIIFEPSYLKAFENNTSALIYAEIDRPTNKYENFSIPRIIPRYTVDLPIFTDLKTAVDFSTHLVEVDRWAAEGHMIRPTLRFSMKKTILNGLSAQLRIWPYIYINKYRQTTDGTTKPQYGISELIGIAYTRGRTTLGADLTLGQRYTAVWKNDYGTREYVEYELDPTWSLGVAHDLLGTFVNESTGRRSAFDFYNERQSRFSGYVTLKL